MGRRPLLNSKPTPNRTPPVVWASALARSLATACAAVPLVIFANSCAPEPPRDVNLLIVSFDTLRADRLGCYGNDEWETSPSPTVDSLAAAGTVFETTYAPRGQTHPSIATMFTGKYPITHRVRENGFTLDPKHTTLMQTLQSAGYHTGVFVSNFEVAHPKEGWVARGANVAVDGFGGQRATEARNESRHQRTWDDRTESAALSFLDGAAGGGPFAAWVHFYDVHKPYTPPASKRDLYGLDPSLPRVLRTPPEGPEDHQKLEQVLAAITLDMREATDAELRRVRGLYDAGINATDDRLARLLARLEKLGVGDDTLIVFTSDHGEELFDRNRYFFHGASIHDGTVRVPLIVKGPGVEAGARVADVTRNADIAPTVLDLLGMPADDGHEGVSLAAFTRGEPDAQAAPHAFIEWQDYVYAVTDGRHKLIFNPEHVWPRKPPYFFAPEGHGYRIDCLEGYDLIADPGERHNLLADVDINSIDLRTGAGLPAGMEGLFPALNAWLRDPLHGLAFGDDTQTDSDLARLQQLGYVGGGALGERKDSARQDPCIVR